jgi:small-conductance mechanosensitive channel
MEFSFDCVYCCDRTNRARKESRSGKIDMHVGPFSNALIVVVLVLVLLALPYAAIGTFGPKARNVVLPFQIVLVVFSVVLLVLTLIRYRLLRSGAALKMRRRATSDGEREGRKKDATCSKYEQQLIRMRSVIVTESILRNGGKAGMLDD